jgi:hypothetical protein
VDVDVDVDVDRLAVVVDGSREVEVACVDSVSCPHAMRPASAAKRSES